MTSISRFPRSVIDWMIVTLSRSAKNHQHFEPPRGNPKRHTGYNTYRHIDISVNNIDQSLTFVICLRCLPDSSYTTLPILHTLGTGHKSFAGLALFDLQTNLLVLVPSQFLSPPSLKGRVILASHTQRSDGSTPQSRHLLIRFFRHRIGQRLCLHDWLTFSLPISSSLSLSADGYLWGTEPFEEPGSLKCLHACMLLGNRSSTRLSLT